MLNDYLVDQEGKLYFTQEGLHKLSPYFNMAGIDIKEIDTVKAYQNARKQAAPFFMRHLSDRADTWPDTDQFKLLKTAIFGDVVDLEREIRLFDLKKSIKVIK